MYQQWQNQFPDIKRINQSDLQSKITLGYIPWERVSDFNEIVLSLEKTSQTP